MAESKTKPVVEPPVKKPVEPEKKVVEPGPPRLHKKVVEP